MAVSDNDNAIFGIVAKIDRAIDISSQARAQNFSSVEAEVVALWNL